MRQEVTESVLGASLDIDSVNAVIDLEIEQIRSIRSDLQSKRDRAQNIINIASIVTGGALGAVNTALQFKSSTANIGNGIGVGGGAASVVLSIVGIHKQGGGRRSLADSPQMLAAFFGRRPDAPEAIASDYPEEVWAYLNSATPAQPEMGTRREQLIAKWRREGRIEQDASPKGERRIEFLSSNISHVRRLSIDELSDRVAMLLDVRATLSLMKRDLREILLGLSAGHKPLFPCQININGIGDLGEFPAWQSGCSTSSNKDYAVRLWTECLKLIGTCGRDRDINNSGLRLPAAVVT